MTPSTQRLPVRLLSLVAILAGSLFIVPSGNSQPPGFRQPGIGFNGIGGRPGIGITGIGGRPIGFTGIGGMPGGIGGMPGFPGQQGGSTHWVCGKCNADLGNMPVGPLSCARCGAQFTNGGKFSPEMAREGGPRSFGITGGSVPGVGVPPPTPFPNAGVPPTAQVPPNAPPANDPKPLSDSPPKPTTYAKDFPSFPTTNSKPSDSSSTSSSSGSSTKSKSDEGDGKTIAIVIGVLVGLGVIAGIVFAVVQSGKSKPRRRRRSYY